MCSGRTLGSELPKVAAVAIDRQKRVFCCLACRRLVFRQPRGRLMSGVAFIVLVVVLCPADVRPQSRPMMGCFQVEEDVELLTNCPWRLVVVGPKSRLRLQLIRSNQSKRPTATGVGTLQDCSFSAAPSSFNLQHRSVTVSRSTPPNYTHTEPLPAWLPPMRSG